jgi:hypothetical protein
LVDDDGKPINDQRCKSSKQLNHDVNDQGMKLLEKGKKLRKNKEPRDLIINVFEKVNSQCLNHCKLVWE